MEKSRSSYLPDPMELDISRHFDLLSRAWTVWTQLSACSLLTFAGSRIPHSVGAVCAVAAAAGLPVTLFVWNGAAYRVVEAAEVAQELFSRTAPKSIAKGGHSRERLKRRLRALPPSEVDLLAAASEAEPKASVARAQLRMAFFLFMLQVVLMVGSWVALAVLPSWVGGLTAFMCLCAAVSCRAAGVTLQLLQRACMCTSAAIRLCGRDSEESRSSDRTASELSGAEVAGYVAASLLGEMRRSLPAEGRPRQPLTPAMLGGLWWLCTLLGGLLCLLPSLSLVGVGVSAVGLAFGCLALRRIGVPHTKALIVVRLCATASRDHTPEQAWDFRRASGQLIAAARYSRKAANLIFEVAILSLPALLFALFPSAPGDSVRIALFVPTASLLLTYARELPISEAAKRIRDVRGRIGRLEATYCPEGTSVHVRTGA